MLQWPINSDVLLPNQVSIWCVEYSKINNKKVLDLCLGYLSNDEKNKLLLLVSPGAREQYLISRALVRVVLSLYSRGIAPKKWEFSHNKYGRPFVSNTEYRHLKFNLSHTKGLVTLAVAFQYDIGIDVERITNTNKFMEIAHRNFSAKEYIQLKNLPQEAQLTQFYRLWTLKEAYIKACGVGLTIPLNHFNYTFSENDDISITFHPDRKDSPELWQFWLPYYSSKYLIGIALKASLPLEHLVIRNANYLFQ